MDHSGREKDVTYWKELAERYKEEYVGWWVLCLWKCMLVFFSRKLEIQKELDDYVEDSRQLEKELETSLLQAEKKNKELELLVTRTQTELEALRVNTFSIIDIKCTFVTLF